MGGVSYERELKRLLESKGWFVVRSAGSLGLGDLVALREDVVDGGEVVSYLVVECKKTRKQAFYVSMNSKTKEQYDSLVGLSGRLNRVCYAVRFMGDRSWYGLFVRGFVGVYPVFRKGDADFVVEAV